MKTRHRRINYRCDLNSVGPVVNPANPSRAARRRHRVLLDMLLRCGDLFTARKIVFAYPYLQGEGYWDKIDERAAELRAQEDARAFRAQMSERIEAFKARHPLRSAA